MKVSLRLLALVPCLAASLTVAGNAQITGTEWNGWSANVPTFGSLPSAASANLTFSATGIDFCEGQTGTGACSPLNNNYTLSGFLGSQGGASGVTGITFHNGAAGGNTLDNTLWEFTGTAFFTNGQTFNVEHDDGTVMYVGGTSASNLVLNQPGPTAFNQTTYTYTGPTGNENFTFLYGETSGAPAVYETNLIPMSSTPEPSSFILLGSGLLAAAGMVRRRMAV